MALAEFTTSEPLTLGGKPCNLSDFAQFGTVIAL